MKKILCSIIGLCMLVVLASCNEKKNAQIIKGKETNVISALSNSYENGAIYIDSGVCSFYDYTAEKSVPLCLKPNCTHSDNSCISKTISSSINGIQNTVIYNDNIFFFKDEESIEGEGRDTTYKITSTLCKCNLQTGEVDEVISVADLNCTASVNTVLNDGIFYFIASNGAYQFEDGTWMNAGFGKQYLCSVDLKNNSFENYGLINDNEYASNNVIITENSINAVSDQVVISGMYNGKIYMYYSYVKDQSIIIDAIETHNYNDINWDYEVKAFDVQNKGIEIIDGSQPICLNDKWYVIETADKKIIANDLNGNTAEFESSNNSPYDCYQYSIYNEKIWDLYTGVVYDLTDNKTAAVADEYLYGNIVDYISTEDKYIVCSYDAKGNLSYSKVDYNTLLAK